MRVHDVAQRTPEWHALRLGALTGSVAADMLATIKTGEAAKRRDLRLRLACERLTGRSAEDGYVSTEMQRGIDLEAAAIAAYEARSGRLVYRSGYLAHDMLPAGCSLDGSVGRFMGIVECKCPKMTTHLRTLQAGLVPAEHMAQITHNLWVSGAAWCDFVSYDDRFPDALQLFVARVTRQRIDRQWVDCAAYELAARLFLGEVDRDVETIQRLLIAGVAA